MEETRFKNSYKTDRHYTSSLSIYNVGYAACMAHHKWGPGVRDHFLLHHVVSGEGYYVVNGKRYHIRENDTFCIFPGETVLYGADEKQPWTYYWVGFNGSDASLLMSQTDFRPSSPIISGNFGGCVREMMIEIYRHRGNRAANAARMTGRLYELLALYIENSEVSRCEGTHQCVQDAVMFIRRNYMYPISAGDIAQAAQISQSQLVRLFQAKLKFSPLTYLTRYRIECAQKLLLQTNLNIGAIANSVGYDDTRYFSRVFRKHNGCSPIQYREQHQADNEINLPNLNKQEE